MRGARLGIEAGVVGQGGDALRDERVPRSAPPCLPRQAIHDARLRACARAGSRRAAAGCRAWPRRCSGCSGRSKELTNCARVFQRQALDDLAPRGRIRGRGQRDARHVRPALVQQRELAVFRAEVVAPLRDAVRLVDGEQGDARALQQRQEARRQQALRRDVEQVELAVGEQRARPPARVAGIERGVEERRAHAELPQRLDLVLHQRDQRRDDDRRALAQQRGQLVAQRLAAAGGHEHQRIAAVGDVRRRSRPARRGRRRNRKRGGGGRGRLATCR